MTFFKCTSLHALCLYWVEKAERKAFESNLTCSHILLQYFKGHPLCKWCFHLVILCNRGRILSQTENSEAMAGSLFSGSERLTSLSLVHFVTVDSHNTNMTVPGLPPLPPSSHLSMAKHLAGHTCRKLSHVLGLLLLFYSDGGFVISSGKAKIQPGFVHWCLCVYIIYPLMKFKNVTVNRLSHIQLFPNPMTG